MPEKNEISVIFDDILNPEPVEYTFRLIFSVLGISCRINPLKTFNPELFHTDDMPVVSYGKIRPENIPGKHIHIYSSDFFGDDYLKPESMPKTPLDRYDGIPVVYPAVKNSENRVDISSGLIETGIDIIASIFFMVSRYEEVIVDTRDTHDRFPATAGLAYREGFLERPIVNEYIELLWRWIHSLAPQLERKPYWPDEKEFAFCLTHDVDAVKRYRILPPVERILRTILIKKQPGLLPGILKEYVLSFLGKSDPYDTFDYMLELEKKHDLKSSFYFMCDRRSKHASRYSVDNEGISNLLKNIEEDGCEVGLHPGYASYTNYEVMSAEKERLDRVTGNTRYGCRQHFLRFKTPETWRIQEKLGFCYDTTLSHIDHIGFRCGICLPFKPFDVLENREFDIWELPLTVMDGSLQNPENQNIGPEEGYQEIMTICDTVRKYGGVFVLLWHNSSLDVLGGWKGWPEVYERLLAEIAGQHPWNGNGREFIEWWERRSSNI